MKTKRSLLNTIKKGKCQYFGHIIRGNGVQRLLMEGRLNGRRGQGRPRTMWTDNMKEWTKISYNDCIRVAHDRERLRSMTDDLLTTDGTSLLLFDISFVLLLNFSFCSVWLPAVSKALSCMEFVILLTISFLPRRALQSGFEVATEIHPSSLKAPRCWLGLSSSHHSTPLYSCVGLDGSSY